MKKGKTTLLALSLGALTYLAFLAYDIKNPEKIAAVAASQAVEISRAAPVLVPVAPRRAKARKAVKLKTPRAPVVAASQAADTNQATVEIPMPRAWDGSFVQHDRPYDNEVCDIDRPCAPRGRDGVLLVGLSFPLNGYQPSAPESLTVGSYRQRTPLLVYQ